MCIHTRHKWRSVNMQMAGRGDDLWKPFNVNKLSNTFQLHAAMCDTFNAILQAMEYKWKRKKLWGYIRRFMRLICWIHARFEGSGCLYRPSGTSTNKWTSAPFTTLSFQIPSQAMTSCAVGLVKSQSLLLGLGLCARHQVETVLLGDTAVANWVTQAKYHCHLPQCAKG